MSSNSSSNPSKRMMEIKNFPITSTYIINNGKPLQKRISSENKRILSSNKNNNNNIINNNELSKNYLVANCLRNFSSSINKNRQINKQKKKSSESPFNMHLINTKLKSGNIKTNPSLSSGSKMSFNSMKKNPKINFGSPQQYFCKSVGKENNIYKKGFKRNDTNNNINNNSNINNNNSSNNNSSNNNITNNLKIKNKSLLSNNSSNSNTNTNNLFLPSANSINDKHNIKVNTCAIYTTGNTSKESENKQMNLINNIDKNYNNNNKCPKTKSAEQNLRNFKKNNKNIKNKNKINRNENKLNNKADLEFLTQQISKNENESKKNFFNKESPNKNSIKNVQDSSTNSFSVNYGNGINNINVIKNNSNISNNMLQGDDVDIEELHFSMVRIMQNFKLSESNF